MSIVTILLVSIGVFLFLFFYWARLKEDYSSLQIFSTAFYVLGAILGFLLISNYFLTPWLGGRYPDSGVAFWGGLLVLLIAFVIGISRFKMKFYESLEAVLVSSMYLLLSFFVADTFTNLSRISLLAGVVLSLFVVLFYLLEIKYKNFAWYKSGKVGFSGLTSVGLFFLVRAGTSFFYPYVLSYIGKYEASLSGIAAFLLFLAVFNLSRLR